MEQQNTLIKHVEKEHLGHIFLTDTFPRESASIDIVDFNLYKKHGQPGSLIYFTLTYTVGNKMASLTLSLDTDTPLRVFRIDFVTVKKTAEVKSFCCVDLVTDKNPEVLTPENKNNFSDERSISFLFNTSGVNSTAVFNLDPKDKLFDVFSQLSATDMPFGEEVNVVNMSYISNFDPGEENEY